MVNFKIYWFQKHLFFFLGNKSTKRYFLLNFLILRKTKLCFCPINDNRCWKNHTFSFFLRFVAIFENRTSILYFLVNYFIWFDVFSFRRSQFLQLFSLNRQSCVSVQFMTTVSAFLLKKFYFFSFFMRFSSNFEIRTSILYFLNHLLMKQLCTW